MEIRAAHLSRLTPTTVAKSLGRPPLLSVHHAELVAIQEACNLIDILWPGHDIYPKTTVTVFTDSQSALRALAKARQQSGQALLRDIVIKLEQLSRRWAPRVQFQWFPGHHGVHGNEQAHTLAQQAREQILMVSTTVKLKSVTLRESQRGDEGKQARFLASKHGKYTKTLDRALPNRHTKRLYDSLTYDEARIVSQLRTGKCRLNSYLYRINATDSDQCELCR